MPVNPLPVLIPIFIVWGIILYGLFSLHRWAGWGFAIVTVLLLLVNYLNTDIERKFDEQMPFRLFEFGDREISIDLKMSDGNRVNVGVESIKLAELLRKSLRNTVHVKMSAWYDYGKLRSYNVWRVEGINPNSMIPDEDSIWKAPRLQ